MPIEVINLTHTYMPNSPFQATAIHDISMEIRENEFIGLIGHTGSGKSTLIQHLDGLLKPTSGAVVVDGFDLAAKETDLRAVRQRVGLVFQYPEYQLFEETVEKDIAFGPRNMKLDEETIVARVKTAAEMVGLSYDLFKKSPFELSGGEKRRVAIAGVLAMEPKTLILDEPVAGLDPRGREEMLSLLKSFHEQNALTILMVSHSMNDVARLCSRILVMNKGALVLSGTPKEIFRHADELSAMGLGVPLLSQLARKLNENGFTIDPDTWQMDDLVSQLLPQLKGGEAV